jgi:hypothetical protein
MQPGTAMRAMESPVWLEAESLSAGAAALDAIWLRAGPDGVADGGTEGRQMRTEEERRGANGREKREMRETRGARMMRWGGATVRDCLWVDGCRSQSLLRALR